MNSRLPASVLLWLAFAVSAAAATFTVNSVADEPDDDPTDGICHAAIGTCTLRAAIEQANATAGADRIEFAIAGAGVHTISPLSRFPQLTDDAGVVIDGYTQPGAAPNSLAVGTNAVLLIELDGGFLDPPGAAFEIRSSTNTIRGLSIGGFQAAILVNGGSGNRVLGCFIGTDPSGGFAKPNQDGVLVSGLQETSPGSVSITLIGDGTAAGRNLLSGNTSVGVASIFADQTSILDNLVGTDATGLIAIPNSRGLSLQDGRAVLARNVVSGNSFEGIDAAGFGLGLATIQDNRIGTTANGSAALGNGTGILVQDSNENSILGNVISGNRQGGGVRVAYRASLNVISGNWIGTDASGSSSIGNIGNGITIERLASGNRIGQNPPNVIAFNGGAGVAIGGDANDPSNDNSISGNSIHDNGGLGIDLGQDGVSLGQGCLSQGGPNLMESPPVLQSVLVANGQTTVDGTLNSLPDAQFWIELFSNAACDRSGHGEGETFLGRTLVQTGANCAVTFEMSLATPLTPGTFVTATAIDLVGNTSEFSACLQVRQGGGNLIADGRAVRSVLDGTNDRFPLMTVPRRSYTVEIDVPASSLVVPSAATPAPAIHIFRSDDVSSIDAPPVPVFGCAPANVAALSFTPSAADLAGGPLRVHVSDGGGATYEYRIRATETTMFCPRWSGAAAGELVDLQNTGDCPINATITFLDSAGSVVVTLAESLAPFGSIQFPAPEGSGGSALLTHDGPAGTLTAGIYLAGTPGASFRWPFSEVRACGATDGR